MTKDKLIKEYKTKLDNVDSLIASEKELRDDAGDTSIVEAHINEIWCLKKVRQVYVQIIRDLEDI